MLSIFSVSFIELAVVVFCWLATAMFYVSKSPRVTILAFASFCLTIAAVFTPADIVSSVLFTLLLNAAFVLGMKHQQRQASI